MVTRDAPAWHAVGLLVLAAACWGGGTVAMKDISGRIEPLALQTTQLAASAALLWVLALRRGPMRLDRATLRAGLLGVLDPGLVSLLILLGLRLTTASMTTLINVLQPVLMLLLAWAWLGERLTPRTLALAMLSLVGVAFVISSDMGAGLGGAALGNMLVLGAIVCAAVYSILARRVLAHVEPVNMVAVQHSVALVLALLALPFGFVPDEPPIAPDTSVWLAGAASGAVYYGVAFWAYTTGLKRAPAAVAALSLNLIPVFGVAGAVLLLGERLSVAQWLGGLLVVAAVVGIALPEGRTEIETA